MSKEILEKLDLMNTTINNIDKRLVVVESYMLTKEVFANSMSNVDTTIASMSGKISSINNLKVDIANLSSDLHKSFISETRWYLGTIVTVVVIVIAHSIQINNAINSFNQSGLIIPIEVTQQP